MPNSFTITTSATDTLKTDAKGHTLAVFTVTNTTSRPVRGMARAIALDKTNKDWLKIGGETERDFPPGGTQSFDVTFDAPVPSAPTGAGAPPSAPEQYSFRLDVASAMNPEEDFTEGPTVRVQLPAPAVVKPPTPFPKWIFIPIAAVLLIGIAVGLFFALRNKNVAIPNVVGMTLDDAKLALESASLVPVEKEVQITGKSPVGQVIDQEPKAESAEVPKGTEVLLISEGEEPKVEVPDVTRLLINDAKARLTEKGFTIVEKGQEVTAGLQPDQVVSQLPAAGTQAKGGSTVELVVAVQKLIAVPDVVFKPLAVATQQLTAAGLTVAQKDPQLAPANVAPGNVKSQNPAAGTKVPLNSAIELVIAATPVTVPDVRNKTIGAAQLTLQQARLDLGNVSGTLTQTNVNTALITSQNPGANTQVAQGSKVNVSVPQICFGRFCGKVDFIDLQNLRKLSPGLRPNLKP